MNNNYNNFLGTLAEAFEFSFHFSKHPVDGKQSNFTDLFQSFL
jgi:hypothetical protein